MQVFRSCSIAIAAAIVLIAGVPRSATALSLADLDAGGSFSVGALTFSDFAISVAGDLSVDLADYPVQLLGDGFRLSGPLTVLLGQQGTLLMSYVVEAAAGYAIDGAALFAPVVAAGSGSVALVSDSLLGPGGAPLGTLLAIDVAGGSAPVLADATGFAAVARLEVVKVVNLGSGVFAAVPHVDQRYFAIPEPITLVLLAGGLGGLALSGRRRAVLA